MRCQGVGTQNKAGALGCNFESWLCGSQFCVTSGQLVNLSDLGSAVVRTQGDREKTDNFSVGIRGGGSSRAQWWRDPTSGGSWDRFPALGGSQKIA